MNDLGNAANHGSRGDDDMHNCELSHEEIDVLRDVLQHAINELDHELSRTDRREFKELLKRRRALLERLAARFSRVPIGA
jgi:hypothetical protein